MKQFVIKFMAALDVTFRIPDWKFGVILEWQNWVRNDKLCFEITLCDAVSNL